MSENKPPPGCGRDFARHLGDISGKYLIPGETQDLALMFVPSESVYVELHDGFDDIVQKAFRAKVVISPSLLMLAIHVIQQIRRDARMREAADKIHAEVGHLMDDMERLHGRVMNWPGQRGPAADPISAEKVERRASRIKEVEFDGEEASVAGMNVIPAPCLDCRCASRVTPSDARWLWLPQGRAAIAFTFGRNCPVLWWLCKARLRQ